MKQLLWVGIGGFLGSIARFKLGGFILHRSEPWNFPLSTLVVNLLGCFAIGLLAALVEHHDLFSPPTRLFLFTGLLGGFTTFSAFAYETLAYWHQGQIGQFVLNAVLNNVLCVLAVALGIWLHGAT